MSDTVMKELKSCSIIIKNVALLTPAFSIAENQAIAVDGNQIVAIGASADILANYEASETIDGRDRLAIPGMYDCHTHTMQQFLKGGCIDEMPIVWRRILVPHELKLNAQDRYYAAKIYCMQALRAGVTMFAEAGSMETDGTLQAVAETGIRGAITRVTRDVAGGLPEGSCDKTASEAVQKLEKLYKNYHNSADGRIQIWFSLCSPQSSSLELIESIAAAAEQYDVGIDGHLCEHFAEVSHCLANYHLRPVELYAKMGVLSPRFTGGHCVMITESDIRLMAERGMSIVHCPTSNLKTHGIPKIMSERAAGINVALGNDGASNARQDMLGQFQLLKYVSHSAYGIPNFDPVTLPYSAALPMCTINGAKALHVDKELGTLEVGKKADIVLMNTLAPDLMPSQDLIKTVSMAGNMHSVTDVIVNGDILIRNREFTKLDEEEILRSGAAQMKDMLTNRM